MSAHRTHAIYDCNGELITLSSENARHAERLAELYNKSGHKNKPFTARPVVVLPAEEYDELQFALAPLRGDDELLAIASHIKAFADGRCCVSCDNHWRARSEWLERLQRVLTTTPTQAET